MYITQQAFRFALKVRVPFSTFVSADMKIAIVGATGPTGLQLVEEALNQGHEVLALVRAPEKLKLKKDKLKLHEHFSLFLERFIPPFLQDPPLRKSNPLLQVQKANIFKPDEMADHLKGCDAVMSCLGTQPSLFSSCTLYTTSIKSITDAMKKAGISKFVCLDSWCTKYVPGNPRIIEWFMRPVFLKSMLADMALMEDYLSEHSGDFNFTVVRAPGLGDGPSCGKEMIVVEGQHVPNSVKWIPRIDIARFMLSCLTGGIWDRKCVAIGQAK